MLSKIIHLEPYFPTGELTVQPVVFWSGGKSYGENITKYASVASDFFKSVTPIPGHSIVYVLAVSSWETYGENRNGDSFPESPYREHDNPPWISAEDTLPRHYKSFEQYGYNYRHHVNKDPAKSVGKVMKAFWNPSMHRVELLIDLDDAKAPDLAERIKNGEFPPVSMGTRVKYDVCSICGNRAPTRGQYCHHLKFQMRDVIDGKKVSALNPAPKFFDISWVFRPADPTAFMLKKVAEQAYEISGAAAGEYVDDMNLRKMAAKKLAVIDKVVQGIPVDAKSEGVDAADLGALTKMRGAVNEVARRTPDLPDDLLRRLSDFPLPKIFSTALGCGGMMLNTPEVIKIVIYKSYPKADISESILDKGVAIQRSVLDLFQDAPQLLDQVKQSGALDLGIEQFDPKIAELLQPYVEKRAGVGQYLYRRFVPTDWRNEAPNTTMLTITDPASGIRYGTTRGAAIAAHDEIAKRNLFKMLGGAAVLGGAYKLVGTGLDRTGFGKVKPLLALGLGITGGLNLPSMGKHYMTDQGIPVPITTELAKVSADMTRGQALSLAVPIFGTLGTMALLSHDYQSRLRSQIPIGYEGLPLSRRILDKVEEFADKHPVAAGLIGTGAYYRIGKTAPVQYAGRQLMHGAERLRPVWDRVRSGVKSTLSGLSEGTKISSCLGEEINAPASTVLMPEVDLDKVAEWLGWVIAEG